MPFKHFRSHADFYWLSEALTHVLRRFTLYPSGYFDTVNPITVDCFNSRWTHFRMTKQKRKNPIGVAFGMLGASKGGKARAAKLSPKRRREIAKKAIAARWAKR